MDRLNTLYQKWKDIYLGGYSKASVNKNEKIILPMIEEILKLLIDRESGAKILVTSKFIAQAFKAFKESSKKLKEKRGLSKSEE